MKGLHPCSSCQRHVKIGATACPFCGALFSATTVLAPIRPKRRIARLAFTAAIANAACSTDTGSLDADAALVAQDVYGAPPDSGDAGMDAIVGDVYGVPADAGNDAGRDAVVFDVYGVPPDSGPDDLGAPTDGGEDEAGPTD